MGSHQCSSAESNSVKVAAQPTVQDAARGNAEKHATPRSGLSRAVSHERRHQRYLAPREPSGISPPKPCINQGYQMRYTA